MQIIFDARVLRESNYAARSILESFTGEEIDPEIFDAMNNHGQRLLPDMQAKCASLTFEPAPVRRTPTASFHPSAWEGKYTLEIDDAAFVRVLRLYVKVAAFLGPIYRQFVAFSDSIFDEIQQLRDDLELTEQQEHGHAHH